ncbi:DEXDc domain containing protein [uncultured Caudovirales phage]|nr:DEXDc domain containing protein [uncultured Caudovirales phage]
MAMTRWFPPGVDSGPRDLKAGQPRAILINDAPGTGKTLQMLMAAVLYRRQLIKLSQDPTSKWFGTKIQPVLIVTQNAQIIQNAFKGDATMAGIELNGQFTETGFEPDEYDVGPDGGRILKGNSWIDIATYSSIKPTTEKVLLFESDGKTAKMQDAILRNEAGNPIPGPDGKEQIAYHPTEVDAKGMPVPLREQAFKMVKIGPPKKGNGKWGVIMFDESHNMKNDTSARSDAGFEIMSNAQHVMLASGTPIDKPTQLGPILGMLLDKPMEEIAAQLGMKLAITTRSADLLLKKRAPEDGAPIMDKAKLEYGTMPADPIEREKAYNNLFIRLRMLRDEAGKAGAILRRSTKYFGVDNIWLDPTDSFHPEGQKALLKLQTWWFNEMALGAEGETGMNPRNMRGMLLFESKRLTSLIKCGIPGTPWNPSDQPKGAAKIMLDELKEGRKVIITMDTSNPFNLADTANIRRFRGLKTTENAPLPYESEWVQWKKYLDSLGIKFGSITGDFGIAEREHTVREFQKNNPDLPVIIMTTMSGGTGLSIDDRHGVGGKTNPKKQYTDAEIATMKQVAAEEIDGQKVESGSLPRTMIIVSSPWGGDVFIQAMGRTDRVLSTTPSRIIVLTSHISEGDEKLADLVRMKTMATNAINETGDELAAAVIMDAAENGAGIKDTEGLKPVKELGGVTAGDKSAESVSEEVKYFKNKAKQTMKKNLAAVDDVVKTNKDKLAQAEKNNSTQRDITRWEGNLESAEAYQKWAQGILKGLEDGSVDYKSVISNLKKYSYEEYKKEEGAGDMDPADEDGGIGGQRNELALDLPFGKAMPVREGVPTSVSGLNRKGKPSRNRQIIDRLYGVNHLASGGKVSEEELAAIEQTVVDIVVPFVEENREGRLSDEKLKSVMRMASDVAHLVHKYEIILKKADVNTKYAGQMSFSGKAILQLLKPRQETRTGPIYHEIGHAIFEMLPEEEKKLVVAELQAARLDWIRELGIEHPLTSIVFPSVDWRDPQGLENYDFTGVQVKKAPVPYSTSKTYTSVIAQRTPGGLLESAKEGVKDRVGPALASKALRIAFNNAVKAGWVKANEMPKFAVEDAAAKGWYGERGQMDVVESGITPQQKATKALLAVFSSSMLQYRNTTRAKMESLTKIVKAKDLTTGVNFDNLEITLHHISSLARGGWGHYSVGEDGSLTLTTRADLAKNSKKHTSTIETEREKSNKHVNGNFAEKIGSAPNMVQIFIPGKDVYEMFVHSFGSINPTGGLAAEVFESPRVATFDFVTMANSVSEVVTGLAEDSMIAHNYKYVNADEWIANNTEILFNDFYDRNEHSDLTGLTASITASIFVNASAGGYGSVVKSIVAALVSGRMTPATAPAGLSLSGAQWHAEYLKGQNVMAANAAANAPPKSEIDDDVLALDPTPIIGPARRKLESAIEGLHAMAASIAESALDSPVISDGSSMSEWLKSVRRRKFQTGRPDNVTGFGVGYKLQHVWGTLIGQVEQIAQITGDPFVAELSARLYPAPNSGLNVRITYTEDVYAHTSYWTNTSSSILRDNGLDRKIKEAKNDKIRRLVQGAENMPGFEDALTKYILKVHNPVYNTLERIQFEIDAIEADDKGNKTLTASLKRELQRFGLSPSEWRKINDLMLSEESDARIDAGSFNKGGKYDKVALGREADAFLSEFIEAGGIDKLMMDVGRSMAIPKDSPEYLTRAQRFEPESIATADALLDGWSSPFLDWAKGMGHPIADWGSSWVPRMVDGNIVSSYGNASGDDFTLTAAKAMLEDNKFQRVRLPASFKAPLTDFSVSSLIVNSSTMPHLTKAEVADLLTQFLDPVTKKDTLTYPSWMAARVAQIISGKTPKESFMGYDVSAVNLVDGKEVEDIDPITGAATPRTEKTTLAQHMSVNLQIYRGKLEEKAISLYGSVRKALTIRSFKDEHEMVSRAIDELSQSHERKVLAGPLTPAAAIAIAKKWKTRIEHRSSGVQSSNQGYADLFGGQHGNMKTPDSMRQRQMDTAAADKILDRFYIRDPRVFLPAYNESVVRNLMLKKHLPEGFFERMQKSITSSPENRRFWPELTYLMAKITNSQPSHDSSTLFKSIVSLASATTFMPVTSVLQLTESMPAGLHTPHFIGSSNLFARLAGSTTPGLVATGNTLRIAALKSANAVVKVAAELATIHSVYVDPKVMELEIDKFMYRLAERSGVIMSTYVDDIPQSSADPRGTVQRFTDKMINRYHRQGNALATVTDMSRVAVLKGNVLMLESTADEILLREFGHYGKNGAPDEASFAKLLKPLEILLLRNLGIPDSELKAFLNHALITRSITQQDISTIPAYKIEQTLRTLIDSGYKEGNLHAQLYSNALNRLNMLTIQRSVPANMSRLRGLVDRHVGVFAGSSMFFLTNFNSALARNVMLPAARMLTSPYTELNRVRNAGDQDKSAPAGTYLTDVGYPVSPGLSTGKMLPAIALMGAMTTFINFETRNLRKWARNDPATTFMDDRTTLLKVFAAIDQAGFTGNLSLPINVAQALRYQRESAQVAAGPFFGGIAGVIDAGRTILSDKNSANTPTAERAFAKIAYDMIIRPIGQVGLQMLTSSGGVGDILNLAGTQAMAHPQTRESFMRWVADDMFNAGNGGKRVPVSKGDLIKAYEKNLITREQMMEGLRIRAQYDSQHAKEMAMREADEAFKRRKE